VAVSQLLGVLGSREFSSPRFQPAFGSSYAYLEGLSRSAKNIEVVVSMGQANLDTVEVRSSSLLVPTTLSIAIGRIPNNL